MKIKIRPDSIYWIKVSLAKILSSFERRLVDDALTEDERSDVVTDYGIYESALTFINGYFGTDLKQNADPRPSEIEISLSALRCIISALTILISDFNKEVSIKVTEPVVERTHSWLNRFRGLLVRWAKKAKNYLAFLHLACGIITWRTIGLMG